MLAACAIGCSSSGGTADRTGPADANLDRGIDAGDLALPDTPDVPGMTDTPDIPSAPLDLSRRLAAGEVAAGRVAKAADLLSGPTAKGRVGDFKIYNSKVAFILQDTGIHSFYERYGGMPVDADVVRDDGEAGGSNLGDLFFGWNLRLFDPKAMDVLQDGRADGRAVIRAKGHDADFPWLRSFVGLVPTDDQGLDLAYEYSLGPDDEFLTLAITVTNTTDVRFESSMVAAAFIMGDGLHSHFPGPGFDLSRQNGTYPGWAGLGDRVSYGLLAGEGPISMVMNEANVAFGTYEPFAIPAGGSIVLTRYLAVSAGGIDDVWRVFRRIRPDGDTGVLEGKLTAAPEAWARGVRLHVLDSDGGHVSAIRPVAPGNFVAELPVGKYTLIAKADGFAPSPPVDVEVVKGSVAQTSLELPSSTPFTFRVTDGTRSIPAKVSFFPKGAPAANLMDAKFGEEFYNLGSALTIYSGTGEGQGVIPHGTWDVYATRGFEYERGLASVTADATALDLPFTLEHSVDSDGWLGFDGHVHATYSPDSDVTEDLRVRTAMAEGQDLLVMTEHDSVRDFSATVNAIPGATAWIRALPGSEVTTYVYGHFNAYPLTEKPDEVNAGGIDWFDIGAPVLLPRIRASEKGDVVIVVNHPRSGNDGYFNFLGLDIAAGTYTWTDNWCTDFDAIEVCNGGCANGDVVAIRDWFDFLDRGYRVSVASGSDAHEPWGVGSPRNYIPSQHGPADFDPAEMPPAFHAQKAFVSTGPFVRFQMGGHASGETLTEAGALAADVDVQAPSWMELQDLRILRNGEVVVTLPVADWGAATGAVRFHDTIDLPAAPSDSWYVLEVRGAGSIFPVKDDVPYAITNPVYVDVDGNGVFDAPKPPYQAASGG